MSLRSKTSASGEMVVMALQYLRARPLRTALTTLAVVLGVALMFAMNLVLPSAIESFRKSLLSAAATADLTITGGAGTFDPTAPMAAISEVPGVKAVSAVLRRQIALPSGSDKTGAPGLVSQFEVVGVDPVRVTETHPYVVTDGRFLQEGDSGVALLPSWLATTPDLQVGGSFALATASGLRTFGVVGLYADDLTQETPRVILTLTDAQAILNLAGMANTIEVALEAGTDHQAVSAAIAAALGESYSVDSKSTELDAFVSLEFGYAVLNFFGLLALFMAAFLIFNTFRTVVAERRRDLALLRAIGATRRQVTGMVMVEGLVQGVVGTAIGLGLGVLLALLLTASIGGLYQQFRSGLALSLSFNAMALLVSVLAGVLTVLAGCYLPARSAARVSPIEALRPTTTGVLRRTARVGLAIGVTLLVLAVLLLLAGSETAALGAMLFLIGIIAASPAFVWPVARAFGPLLTLWFAREGELARENLARHPSRAAVTAGTLMVGLATLVLLASLVGTIGGLMTDLANRNFTSDAMFIPASVGAYGSVVGADQSLLERVRRLPSVALATSLRYASSVAAGNEVQVLGVDPAAYTQVGGLAFAQGDSATAFPSLANGRNAIITSIAAKTLGLAPGSTVTLQTAEGPRDYQVVAVGDDLLDFKLSGMFISQDNLLTDFHKTEDVMLMVNYVDGADRDAALADLRSLAADYPQFTVYDTGEYRASILESSRSALGVFYALAALILIPAALGLLNTLTISVIERTREIGMARAIGASRSQVRRIVTGEALLLGLFGAAMGVVSGVALSYGFVRAFSLVGWALPYTPPLGVLGVAIVVAVIMALLAAILPARNAARLDIIRALQYE